MATSDITSADQLKKALRAAKGGETLSLQGSFGGIEIEGLRPDRPITLDGRRGAHFESFAMRNCANLHLSNLSFWPLASSSEIQAARKRAGAGKGKGIPFMLTCDAQSAGIEVSGCIFRGRKDSDGFSNWSREDWVGAKVSSVLLDGQRSVIRDNRAIGVYHGFFLGGPSSELVANTVFGFSGDGMRVMEDNCVVIGNRITDGVHVDPTHPDALQVYKHTGPLRGLVIKDNVIKEWTVRPDNPFRIHLQGIGLHNGPYFDVVIRDNRIESTSFEGIHLHDVTNLELVGNIVRSADRQPGVKPRINLQSIKGTVVFQDNQAEKIVGMQGTGNREPDYMLKF